jgi:hypothetical protein
MEDLEVQRERLSDAMYKLEIILAEMGLDTVDAVSSALHRLADTVEETLDASY